MIGDIMSGVNFQYLSAQCINDIINSPSSTNLFRVIIFKITRIHFGMNSKPIISIISIFIILE